MSNIEVRKLLGRVADIERRVRAMASTPQLSASSIEDGGINEYDADGNIVGRTGSQFDGTHGSVTLGGPNPPTPTTPIVTTIVGGAKVRWDGEFVGGEVSPMDFSRVEVHVSDEPDFEPVMASTLRATIETPRGNEVVLPLAGGNAVSVSLVGISGNWTATGGAVDVPIPEGTEAGDLMVVIASGAAATGGLIMGGWVKFAEHNDGHYSACWRKRADTVDIDTGHVTISLVTAGARVAAVCRTYRGAADAISAWALDTGATISHTTHSTVLTTIPCIVVEALTAVGDNIAGITAPSGTDNPAAILGPVDEDQAVVWSVQRFYDESATAGGGTFVTDVATTFATSWTIVITPESAAAANYIKLVTKAASGKASTPSAQATAFPTQINVDEAGVGAVAGSVQSTDYSEGTSGYRFSSRDSQVNNLNVMNELGAHTLAVANSLTIDNIDLMTMLSALPKGVIAYGIAESGIDTGDIGTTETVVYRGTLGPVEYGRVYKVLVQAHVQFPSAVGGSTMVDGAQADIRIRYTVDGSTPTTSSSVLRIWRVNSIGGSSDFTGFKYYIPGGGWNNVRFAVTLDRVGSTSSFVRLYGQNPDDRPLEVALEDCGLRDNLENGALVQISKWKAAPADPEPAPEPDKPTTYTKSWNANWSRSFDSDNSARSPDTNDLYQGYVSGTHGNTRSLFGFDNSSIQSALSGATIKSVKLTFRVRHAYWNAGMNVRIRSHNRDSRPSSWSGVSGSDRASRNDCKAGGTYTVTLPIAVGNEFKSGSTKGLGFGPGSSSSVDYYGRMYGAGSGYAPKLTITYSK